MASFLKRSIKNTFHLFGFDVFWHVLRPRQAMWTLLELYQVDTIFDVGANNGVSGQYFRNMGFNQKIVSFEPVNHFYRQLEQKASRDELWFCENAALGEAEAELEINVSGESGGASSFLEMTDHIGEAAPELNYVGKEVVRVKTVDSVIDQYYSQGDRLFLKLDVQGYEKNVLAGARNSLDRIVGMRIEMSVVKSYEGEPLMCEMLPFLNDLGFKLVSIENAWSNEVTQELYQVDGILFRTDRL